MSLYVDAAFIEQWNMEAEQELQRKQTNLMSGVRVARNVKGKQHNFQVVGAGDATVNRPTGQPIQPMNVGHRIATAVLKRVEAPEWVDNFDQVRTNVDLRREYTTAVVNAIGRKWDEIIVEDALESGTNTNISNTLNKAGLITLHKTLTGNHVPMGFDNRYLLIGESALEDLLTDTTIMSRDYIENNATSTGVVPNVMGFTLIYTDNSLLVESTPGTHRFVYAWYKRSVGVALAQGMQMYPTYRGDIHLWQVLGELFVGATDILNDGILKAPVAN